VGRGGGGPIEGGGPKRGRQNRAEGRGSRANRGRRGEGDGAPGAKAEAERPTIHGVLGITRTTRTPLVAAFAASESVASVTPGEPGPRPLVERLLGGSDPWSLAATLSFVPAVSFAVAKGSHGDHLCHAISSREAGPKGARSAVGQGTHHPPLGNPRTGADGDEEVALGQRALQLRQHLGTGERVGWHTAQGGRGADRADDVGLHCEDHDVGLGGHILVSRADVDLRAMGCGKVMPETGRGREKSWRK